MVVSNLKEELGKIFSGIFLIVVFSFIGYGFWTIFSGFFRDKQPNETNIEDIPEELLDYVFGFHFTPYDSIELKQISSGVRDYSTIFDLRLRDNKQIVQQKIQKLVQENEIERNEEGKLIFRDNSISNFDIVYELSPKVFFDKLYSVQLKVLSINGEKKSNPFDKEDSLNSYDENSEEFLGSLTDDFDNRYSDYVKVSELQWMKGNKKVYISDEMFQDEPSWFFSLNTFSNIVVGIRDEILFTEIDSLRKRVEWKIKEEEEY